MSVNRIGAIAAVVAVVLSGALHAAAANPAGRVQPGQTREWPCRIVVQPPLLQAVGNAWQNSESFRRLCEALADKRAVAALSPGAERSGSRALSRISRAEDGVVVGRVAVPLNVDTIEYIAHELEHILERAEGLDLSREAERKGSGVWRALDGFETQRAIDKGRQVAHEVRESIMRAR